MNERFRILSCYISRLDTQNALAEIKRCYLDKIGGYVCFSNVHTIVTSEDNNDLRMSTNNSLFSMPDGKPLSIYANMKGYKDVGQVAGPDFMPLCISKFTDAKHYFYGSTQKTLDVLKDKLESKYPQISIVGMYSPPFRELSKDEVTDVIKNINNTSPDFIWVGLGAPKQEIWMMENYKALSPAILFGVGAAFDFHAGLLKRSPEWMKNLSLEWLYRLMCEPRRLWRRYLFTNARFMFYLVKELFNKKY